MYNCVGLPKDFTTEITKSTEKKLEKLCGLCALRGKRFFPGAAVNPILLDTLACQKTGALYGKKK
jgi:hypothetical protein